MWSRAGPVRTLPFWEIWARPSRARALATACVLGMRARQESLEMSPLDASLRGISEGQQVLATPRCRSISSAVARRRWPSSSFRAFSFWASSFRASLFWGMSVTRVTRVFFFEGTSGISVRNESRATRPLLSKRTPSLSRSVRLRSSWGPSVWPPKPVSFRSPPTTRCQFTASSALTLDGGNGLRRIAPPTARAEPPVALATAP
mmetsp:Transcript_5121/g.16113  ORF Transcript_5121/g.16113 Transcript_5121/m.16113 type:complete len:204 (-) Transcript_5121:279-890(-)